MADKSKYMIILRSVQNYGTNRRKFFYDELLGHGEYPFSADVLSSKLVCSLSVLTITTHWAKSEDNKLIFFLDFFPQKIGFDISCKYTLGDNLHETSSRKNKNISKWHQLKSLLSMLCQTDFWRILRLTTLHTFSQPDQSPVN